MTIGEKVAYLKGIAEGVDLDAGSKSGKILSGIIEVLEEISDTLQDMEGRVDAIDEDLAVAEEILYDDDFDLDEDEEEDDDDPYEFEFECPNCHETIFLDASLLEDSDGQVELECPSCGEKLDGVFDFGGDEDEEDT